MENKANWGEPFFEQLNAIEEAKEMAELKEQVELLTESRNFWKARYIKLWQDKNLKAEVIPHG